jgi:hypothetical protein
MEDKSGMRLDITSGEGNELFDNRDQNVLVDLNQPYGFSEKQEEKSPFYMSYFRIFGDCLTFVFSCGPKVCPQMCVEVPQGFIGLKMEAGAFIGKLRPGVHKMNPFLHKVDMVDMRAQTLTLPHQFVLSKDNVAFEIDAVINFRVLYPEVAHFKIRSYQGFVTNVAQAALKAAISEQSFSYMLASREKVNSVVQAYMEPRLELCGLEIDFAETLSIRLSDNLESALAVVAESENRAKAKVINSLADLETSKQFTEAASRLDGNETSVMLQKWETFHQIGQHQCATLVLPHDFLGRLRSACDSGTPTVNTDSQMRTPFDD